MRPVESVLDDAKLIGVIRRGFDKVASVIDSNSNYDYILGQRLVKPEYEAVSDAKGFVPSGKALSFMEGILKSRPVLKRLIPRKSSKVNGFFYGSTKNNKREFDFFKNKAKEFGFDVDWVNIEECPGERTKSTSVMLRQRIVEAYYQFLSDRPSISKSVLHQSSSYALSLLAAWETLSGYRPEIFVVANDHSPIPVAYAKVAEIKGSKTLYIQHAEVTDAFPILDFSFSILRNKVSLDIYSKKGILGKAVYSSRVDVQLDEKQLMSKLDRLKFSRKIPVVIYPSSIFNYASYMKLVEELDKNVEISSVSTKFHPSFKSFDQVKDDRVKVLDEFPREPHIAICGNSSVVVELLEKGNLVFNLFDLDDISPDYYGFVDKGLTRHLTFSEVSGRFWASFDESKIVASLADYFPSIDSPRNVLETFRVREVFGEILASDNINFIRQTWFERDSFLFGKSFLSLLAKNQSFPYEEYWVVLNLNRLFDNRDSRLQRLYRDANLDSCSSVFEFWVNTKVMEWNGRLPSPRQLDMHLEFVQGKEGEKKLRGWMELKCFDIVLRFGALEQLVRFLNSAKVLNVYKLGINKKIAFLNFCKANSESSNALCQFYDVSEDNYLTDLDKLKIYVQSGIDLCGYYSFCSYFDIENYFLKFHPRLSQEYLELVREPYQLLGERTCFIDVKRNEKEEQSFLGLIKEKLASEEGFSFIRLSDGEGFIFQSMSEFFTFEDSRNRQRHWWGEEIPAEVCDRLLLDLEEAVKAADVLGIPSIYRFVRDHSDKTTSLKQSLQGRGLVSVLAALDKIDTANKLYTDDKANIAVFNRIDVICDLAKRARKVVIVNSGSYSSVKDAFGKFFDYEHVQVPTHHKTSLNNKYHSSSRPLPYVYREVANKIEEVTVPGALVLVGAGVAGKVFMHAAQKRGGVALDLGSAMDQFLSGGIHSLF